ncbi:hypothetical protein PRZ48_006882 [Zasmidium cellare]|uniref:Carrier domain-containing protein n=1 Tax=Zasmidium cellare TaxID=395010 RepID=A0ABR0EHT8_ZASCE|nr:hypothetical protein PRZ48_006882 [Zasmidium cellare]
MHVKAGVEVTMLPPSLIVDLARNDHYLENLSKMSSVVFSGGPLPESTGKLIAERTVLSGGYGASETSAVPQLPKDREDWAWFRFDVDESGLEFRERDNGLFEMVICRHNDPVRQLSQPVFFTIPELQHFETKDLFAPHPSKPGLWKYISRLDDLLILSNGEKVNPVVFEGTVGGVAGVKGCLMIGQGRFQPILLVEPVSFDREQKEMLESIWPVVMTANRSMPAHGRVLKDNIMFALPDKPLPRAGKGTIQRRAANELYSGEIDAMFLSLGSGTGRSDSTLNLSSLGATRETLQTFISNHLHLDDVTATTDFFALGMDSLQVINIVRVINAANPTKAVDAKDIYDHPTVESLAGLLHQDSKKPAGRFALFSMNDDYQSDDEDLEDSWLAMEQLYRQVESSMSPEAGNSKSGVRRWFRSSNDEAGPVVPPDGGTVAWLQVLAMFLVNLNNWGLVNSFGVFQAYYAGNPHFSAYSDTDIAWIGTLQGALLLIVGIISGPLFDKGFLRTIMLGASIGLVFALMMLSLATRYYEVMLTQGLLCGICSGLLYIPSIALIPVYFKRRRGLALGMATGGGPVGGVVYPIVFTRLLEEIGFSWAVRTIGFIALLTLGIAVLLTKPLSARAARELFERSAWGEQGYIFITAAAFFLLAGMFVPYFLAPQFASSMGVEEPTSYYTLSIISAAQFFGRLLPAWASDIRRQRYWGPEASLWAGDLGMAILGFCWIAVHNLGGYIPWLVLYGFFSGGEEDQVMKCWYGERTQELQKKRGVPDVGEALAKSE